MCTQSKSLALIASGGKDGGLLSLKIPMMFKTRNNSASQRTWPKVPEANPSSIPSILVDIPGLLDLAVEEYTDWHLCRVSAASFKANIKKVGDVALYGYHAGFNLTV